MNRAKVIGLGVYKPLLFPPGLFDRILAGLWFEIRPHMVLSNLMEALAVEDQIDFWRSSQ